MLTTLKKLIALDNPIRLLYHKLRAILANIIYWFPSKNMIVIGVTGTNGKTTTCNLIAKWLRQAGKKVFMFSTVNIILNDQEEINTTKMTSPDAFELQRLLKIAKKQWCEIAVIETASHGIKMNRIWWIDYDFCVLTNISQDHLDLHKTMDDYVHTKLKIFKNLMLYKRKSKVKKTAVINMDSDYSELFLAETYDTLFTYGNSFQANIKANNIQQSMHGMKFEVQTAGEKFQIETNLRGNFNVYNILAAIWVFIWFGIKAPIIKDIFTNITTIPGRMEEIENNEKYKIFVDYAHTPDALEKVLETLRESEGLNNIITVFWATWDRDKMKRPIMWEIVSRLSDTTIVTQDDDYSEKTQIIIKDVLSGIDKKEWEWLWVIPDREEAIRTALISAKENDIVLVAGKWDEHTMVTNKWIVEWHDKTIIQKLLQEIDDNKIL